MERFLFLLPKSNLIFLKQHIVNFYNSIIILIRETAGWKNKSGTFFFFLPKSNLIFLKQHIVNFDSAERNLLVCRKDLSGSMETKFISQFRNLDFYIKTLFLLRICSISFFLISRAVGLHNGYLKAL